MPIFSPPAPQKVSRKIGENILMGHGCRGNNEILNYLLILTDFQQ